MTSTDFISKTLEKMRNKGFVFVLGSSEYELCFEYEHDGKLSYTRFLDWNDVRDFADSI